MAVDLQKLKRKMRGVTSTRQVTRALQMVSTMKMRKAREQSEQSRAYRRSLQELLDTFDSPPSEVVPELAAAPSQGAVLLVTFASDRGLCGPYNTNILNLVAAQAREIGNENLEIRSVGIKVGNTLARRGYRVISRERRPGEHEREGFLLRTSRELFSAWSSGKYGRIELVYSCLRGMTVEKPRIIPWLPLESVEEDSGSSSPSHGLLTFIKYIDEPVTQEVLAQAIRRHLHNELLSAILHSEASEHVARMIAMDNATRNAEELFASLQLTYNKARQAKITQEICEIVAGANAI